jgi:O-antigen/teichoic acid export membrane protein
MAYRLLTVALGMAFTALVARELGRESFGELSYVLSFWTVFSIVVGFGSSYPFVVDYVACPRETRPRLLGSYLSLGILGAVLGFLACWFGAAWAGMSPERVLYVRVTAFSLLIGGFRSIQFEMNASEDLQSISRIQFLQTGGNLLLTWILLRRGYRVGGVLAAGLGANLWATLLTYHRVRQRVSIWPAWHSPTCKRLVWAGIPMMLSSVVLILLTRLDIFMLDALRGVGEVGTYAAATRFLEMARLPTNILLSTAFPAGIKASMESREEAARLFYQLWRGLVLLAAPAAVGLAVASPSLITFLFGSRFLASVHPLQILAIHAFLSCFVTLCHQALMTDQRNWILFSTSAASLALNALLNLLWIPFLGVAGAAWASVLSTLLLSATLHWYTRERTGFTLRKIFNLEILRILLASLLMGIPLAFIRHRSIFLVLPVAGLCYLVALLLTGGLKLQEAKKLVGLQGRETQKRP